MMLSNVLLPEPDGPTSAVSSPWPRRRSTPSSARVRATSPYSLTTCSTARTGAASAIADRRRRIEPRRPARGDHGGQEADAGREHDREREQRQPELDWKLRGTARIADEVLEQLRERRAEPG